MDDLFCKECFNLLNLPTHGDSITCNVCGKIVPSSVLENKELIYSSNKIALAAKMKMANLLSSSTSLANKGGTSGGPQEGATIKEKCPKCGHPEMTFHTMQLRSADEGQTVFYVCPSCSYKYSVNT